MARKSPRPDSVSTGKSLVPVPRYDRPDPTKRGGMPIGALLELARKRAGYSESAACRVLSISEYELARYEAGVRTPSKALLEEFSELYDADLSGDKSAEEGKLHLGWADVDLSGCSDNECRLRRIAATLRSIRRVDVGVPLVIRTDELALIAGALDVGDPDLEDQLGDWLVLPAPEASELAGRLRTMTAEEQRESPRGGAGVVEC
jgi:transcriptional regulator with XRE-family HTH domain